MKNNIIKSVFICVICGLTFTHNASAVLKYYTSGTYVETGSTYTGAWSAAQNSYAAPLRLSGSETVYSGTNITLIGDTIYNSNAQKGVLVQDGASLSLHDSTFSSGTVLNGHGIWATSTTGAHSSVYIDNMTFTLNATWSDAVLLDNASSGTLRNITVTGSKFADMGVVVSNTSSAYIENASITLSSYWSYGVQVDASSSAYVASSTINIINDSPAESSTGIINNGTLTVTDVTVNADGPDSGGIKNNGDGNMSLSRVEIHMQNNASNWGALSNNGDSATLAGHEVTIVSDAIGLKNNSGHAEFWDSTLAVTGTAQAIVINSGTVIWHNGTINLSDGSNLLLVSGSNTNTVTLDNVAISGSGNIVTGTAFVGDRGEYTDFTGATIINVIGGSGINGDVIGSESGTLNVNFNDSSLTGDVTQNDDSSVTIELHNGSTGSGGFNGGNLNVNDGGSLWTFDKDSHVNNALNNGTLNIGSQDVTFDHLTNNGLINLDLNTDTGAGGSVAVTGTAAGNGSIHVDATGNGSKDPNSVLPGKVTGDGTENWTWDPVDWGLEKVIKDGDRFVRDGISSAGAVLNSSNALQQAMWFAQQNSLLKRMGELRFAQKSETGKVKSEDGLIENVWIRSYGQQLNVGGKVSGHSYEQMVYGVDLGTDHKWTLDDRNVIYTGVYAGYGRSDVDYRVAGTEGTLNSYYGGIYTTWLHDSGLYVDLTFKAASVDNELKAPYGANQLTADYNDLNLGGSIEVGKKFSFQDDWFIEPQVQVNYLHILAEDYRAAGMSIEAQDLDAIQFRVGSLFGRTIKFANGGALQPYLKVSGVEMVSSGGAIRNGYQSIRSNIDGARAELGGGIIWQMDDRNQLHFDYEASFGDKYDKPWGLNFGYRHQF